MPAAARKSTNPGLKAHPPLHLRKPPYRFHVVKVRDKSRWVVVKTFTHEEAEEWVKWFTANRENLEDKYEVFDVSMGK